MKKLSYLFLLIFFTACSASEPIEAAPKSFEELWGLAENTQIEEFTSGLQFPTSFVIVQEDDLGPDDPFILAAELFGKIKLITRDGQISIFAEDFFPTGGDREFSTVADQYGLGGLCLAEEEGYLFATYVYVNESDGLLYNGISRFDIGPWPYSSSPESPKNFDHILAAFPTSPSHQIGNCLVQNGTLFVGVGDGERPHLAQDLDTPYGKILHMDLDGNPLPENPFFSENNELEISDYVWALGLRNPFALTFVDQRLFTVDNGLAIDRFLEIHPGENYLWEGRDISLGSRAISIFAPSIGPVHLEYVGEDEGILPKSFANGFFVSTSASNVGGIYQFNYSFDSDDLLDVPEFILRYRGSGKQIIAAMAVADDGLYFAPFIGSQDGNGPVYRISLSLGEGHPYGAEDLILAPQLMREKNCWGCHKLNGAGGDVGPNLDYDDLVSRISTRLSSDDYVNEQIALDRLDEEPFSLYREERHRIRELSGMEQIEAWTINQLVEPRFDNPGSQMPNLGLSNEQAEAITEFLLTPPEREPLQERLVDLAKDILFDPSHIAAFLGGAAASYFFIWLYQKRVKR